MSGNDARGRLIEELTAVPRASRLAWLADLPEERRAAFRAIMPPDDARKLNQYIAAQAAERKKPSVDSWLAEARAGEATSPDAMIQVLREIADRLRPSDLQWLDRIERTAAGRSWSRKQAATVTGIYRRYFGSATGDD